MPSNHLFLCCPLLFLPSLFISIRVFSNESAFRIRCPKYRSFTFNISPSNERLVPHVCKDQLMCSPTCISSQVPALVPVTHFLSCWEPGTVLSLPRICCDSVGSSFSRALSCPSLGAASPWVRLEYVINPTVVVCKVSLDKSADLLRGVLLRDRIFFFSLDLRILSLSLHLDSLFCESWRRLFWIEDLGWLISFLNLDVQIFSQVWKFTGFLSFFFNYLFLAVLGLPVAGRLSLVAVSRGYSSL